MKQNGIVMRSTGSWYEVLADNEQTYNCRLKGKFKIQDLKTNNPIAVGDHVKIDDEGETDGDAIIFDIKPRQNYIIRKSVHKTAHVHMLAANIDQAVLIVTHNFPKTSLGFIDRFLVTAESFRIPVIIIFNKKDLLTDQEVAELELTQQLYESLGYPCHFTSAEKNLGIDIFEELLTDKVSLIAGHSGVGKSSLVNCIAPQLKLATTEVSTYANKGVHTTTFATMFQLKKGTFIIDSPGIKELGIAELENDEISHYFPEMRALLNECKYNNCQHINEPKCAVLDALEEGTIALSRYKSYLSIMAGEDNRR